MKLLHYFAIAAMLLAPAFTSTVLAEEKTEKAKESVAFVLKDKSTVRGVITSFKDGVYEVESQGIGTVKIKADKIASIDYEPDAKKEAPVAASAQPATRTPVLSAADTAGQIEAFFGFEQIFQTLMSDPAIMTKIRELAEDPQFLEAINDPEITKAIENGNFVALAQNRKLLQLMQHPKVKEIAQSITKQEK